VSFRTSPTSVALLKSRSSRATTKSTLWSTIDIVWAVGSSIGSALVLWSLQSRRREASRRLSVDCQKNCCRADAKERGFVVSNDWTVLQRIVLWVGPRCNLAFNQSEPTERASPSQQYLWHLLRTNKEADDHVWLLAQHQVCIHAILAYWFDHYDSLAVAQKQL
jgi:hypothetical protein